MVTATPVSNIIPNAGVYVQVLRFFVVLLLGLLFTRAVLVPGVSLLMRRRDVKVETQHTAENLSYVIGIFFSFTIALQAGNFGSLVTVIGAIAAAMTVAIGFGMRDQISNLVAGVFIFLNNPFLVGDYIKTEETEGVVEDISILSTTLTGSSSQTIIVPNSQLTMEEVKNYTRDWRTKASISVELPVEQLPAGTDLLREIAVGHEAVLDDPPPDVFYTDSEGVVSAELHYWLADSSQSKQVKSEILEAFTKDAVAQDMLGERDVADKPPVS